MNGYINKKTKALDNLKKVADSTSGEVRKMWIDKWYEMVKTIASDITTLDHNSATIKKSERIE